MTSEVVASFLADFFGEGNDLSPSRLSEESPELAGWLNDRLEALRRDPDGTHVLPRRHGGHTFWYGIAHSTRQLRALQQALEAFIGTTYARVSRQAELDTTDPVEAAVEAF